MVSTKNVEISGNVPPVDPVHDVQVLAAVLRSSEDEQIQVRVLHEMTQAGFVHFDEAALRRQRILSRRKRDAAAHRLMQQVRGSILPRRTADTYIDYEDD